MFNAQGSRLNVRRRPWLRWTLAIGFLPACIIAFYLIENYRGEKAWAEEEERQLKLGESLTFQDHLPKPLQVPDIENAANVPAFTSRLDPQTKTTVPELALTDVIDLAGAQGTGGPGLTLEQWQKAFAKSDRFPKPSAPGEPAKDILLALSLFDRDLSDLRNATNRPHGRFPVHWEDGIEAELPQHPFSYQLLDILHLHVRATLSAGQPEDALADVLLMLRLTEWVSEPNLLGLLVQQAMLLKTIHAIQHGLVDDSWSEPQLAKLGAALTRFDLPAQTLRSLRGERALGLVTTRIFLADRSRMLHLYEQMKATPAQLALIRLMPKGWLLQIQAAGCREIERFLIELQSGMTAPGHFKVIPGESDSTSEAYPLGIWLARKLEVPPSPFTVVMSGARKTCARIALARAAIFINVYSKAFNRLPEALPATLPPDPITGQPLHYQVLDRTQYRLWSVGPNQQDDKGSVEAYNTTETLDWVW